MKTILSLESLDARETPATLAGDGPGLWNPFEFGGITPPARAVPAGSPVVTIDVLVIQWVTARL